MDVPQALEDFQDRAVLDHRQEMAITEAICSDVDRDHLDDSSQVRLSDEGIGSQVAPISSAPFAPVKRLDEVLFIACGNEVRGPGGQGSRENACHALFDKYYVRANTVIGLIAFVEEGQKRQDAANAFFRYLGGADLLLLHLEIPLREVADVRLVGRPKLVSHTCDQLLVGERVQQDAIELGGLGEFLDLIPVTCPIFPENIVPEITTVPLLRHDIFATGSMSLSWGENWPAST